MARRHYARSRLHIQIGDLLELAGAGLGCYAVADLVGVGWSLLLAAALILAYVELPGILAFLRKDGPPAPERVITIPLPYRPQPRVRLREYRQRFALKWAVWRQARV